MTISQRACLLAITFLLSFSTVFAQNEASADTAFKAVMEKSFQELDESNYAEDVQRKYADIFWDYYL